MTSSESENFPVVLDSEAFSVLPTKELRNATLENSLSLGSAVERSAALQDSTVGREDEALISEGHTMVNGTSESLVHETNEALVTGTNEEGKYSSCKDEEMPDDEPEKKILDEASKTVNDEMECERQTSVVGKDCKEQDKPEQSLNSETINGDIENSNNRTNSSPVSIVESVLPSSATLIQPPSQFTIGQTRPNFKSAKVESTGKGTAPGPNYRPVAKLLINIGLELVREGVIKNLIEIQMEKEKQQKLDQKEKMQLEKLDESWKSLVKKNQVYGVPIKNCRCSFAGFTETTLELHRQFGHGSRPGRYRCCYCTGFKTNIPAKYASHMSKEHKKFARLLPVILLQCPFCPFEHKLANHLERHVNSCQKRFILNRNLVFSQNVFDIPVYEALQKPKVMPVQVPVRPNTIGYSRMSGISTMSGISSVNQFSNPVGLASTAGIPNSATGLSVTDILSACGLSPQIQAQVLSNLSLHSSAALNQGQSYPRVGFPSVPSSRTALSRPSASAGNWMQFSGGAAPRMAAPVPSLRPSIPSQSGTRFGAGNMISQQQKHLEQLKPGIVLMPSAPGSGNVGQSVPMARRVNAPSARINPSIAALKCEICDQPARDLESLRLHLLAVHREPLDSNEFHKKGRTLNCPACSESFWTKQGAVRHYQMRHSASVPRAYHCIKCGVKIVTSILNHLSSQHNITVLDMYEAKFCMLCNTSLKSLNLFESHVVSEHADIFPNRLVLLTMIKALNAASLYKTMGKPDLRPMKPLPPGFGQAQLLQKGPNETSPFRMERAGKGRAREKFSCQDCCFNFSSAEELALHYERDHIVKCSRCSERWSSLELMQRHFMSKHHSEKDPCILCGELVQIGRPTVRHIKRMHIRACSVVIQRLRPKEAMRYLTKRRRQSLADGQQGCSGLHGVAKVLYSDGISTGESNLNKEEVPKVEEVMEVDGETIVIETNG